MKKSEMVKIMQEFFINNYKGHTYKEVMSLLLDHLEEQGMLPPKILNKNYNGWKSDYSGVNQYINNWESED